MRPLLQAAAAVKQQRSLDGAQCQRRLLPVPIERRARSCPADASDDRREAMSVICSVVRPMAANCRCSSASCRLLHDRRMLPVGATRIQWRAQAGRGHRPAAAGPPGSLASATSCRAGSPAATAPARSAVRTSTMPNSTSGEMCQLKRPGSSGVTGAVRAGRAADEGRAAPQRTLRIAQGQTAARRFSTMPATQLAGKNTSRVTQTLTMMASSQPSRRIIVPRPGSGAGSGWRRPAPPCPAP